MAKLNFYDSLPRTTNFSDLARAENFTPLPDDWFIGCCDIVDSTGLIAAGRYKTVNMIGASVISALTNAMQGRAFPYVFGGDGASFAIPPSEKESCQTVLANLRSWVAIEFDVELRAALLPLQWVRAEDLDVRVARHAVSAGVDYAMFSGGGLAWVDKQMKLGGFSVHPAEHVIPPDLTGLSCRWSNIKARNGTIVSLVLLPAKGGESRAYTDVISKILVLAAKLERNGHPVPQNGPPLGYPPPGLTLEAQVSRGSVPLVLRKLRLLLNTAVAGLMFWSGRTFGGFDPTHYRRTLSANADFQKFDDGLKMTLDCDTNTRNQLTELLQSAKTAGHIRYGLHEQEEAMVTCIVPSALRDDHVHFVDGAAGGYTSAAARIKAEEAITP
ncbi:DUF3095 domain-containing protein [Parasedimentitalea maritima]|uniref:DUF3095 family protein n=1 Tax=Parasedimentitalea maritima TaxID=2578117 RepID=A0A6A4RMY0_9RHOB|nr:DUF3095 domain-containing protein [Zongyanglinia marina]KAE9632341.1 DUF3095 family protein [Zongyanglinia marina]